MSEMVENAIVMLSDTAVANLSVEDETTLYTVRAGKILILTEAWLRVAGDVGAALEVSIGADATPTDFVASTAGDNLDAAGDVIILKPVPSATPETLKSYAAATVIKFDVIAAGNAVAGRVFLFGFEYDA